MSIKKENPKADFISIEHDILNFWEKNKIFQKLVEQNSKGDKWSFLDGPITANNPMGVHHAWGRTLKDIYLRRVRNLDSLPRFTKTKILFPSS